MHIVNIQRIPVVALLDCIDVQQLTVIEDEDKLFIVETLNKKRKITCSKKRKLDCGFLYCGGDAIIGNNLNVAGTITGNVDITPQITDLASGSASVPSVGFASSSNTGIYLNTSNSGLAITASGTNIGTFFLNGSTPELLMGTHGVVYAPSGFIGVPFISNGDSSSSPGHTWSSDTKSGLYLPSLGIIGFSSGGTHKCHKQWSYHAKSKSTMDRCIIRVGIWRLCSHLYHAQFHAFLLYQYSDLHSRHSEWGYLDNQSDWNLQYKVWPRWIHFLWH